MVRVIHYGRIYVQLLMLDKVNNKNQNVKIVIKIFIFCISVLVTHHT